MFIHRILTRIHKNKNSVIAINQIATSKNTVQYAHFSSRKIVVNKVICTPSRRHLSLNNFTKPSLEKFKRIDNIPNDYELIYRSNLSQYLYAARISAVVGLVFVFGTAIINFCMGSKGGFIVNLSEVYLMNMVNDKAQYITISVVFMLLNIAILFLITKFPVRMYYNEKTKKFITVLYGIIPQSMKFITINSGEVVHVQSSAFNNLLPWNESRYRLKNGKRIILLDHYFRKLEYLNILLGHAKM